MEEKKYYGKEFYNLLQNGSYISAKKVLPVVQNLFHPSSVLDLGCGVGYWIKVWKDELEVEDVLGIGVHRARGGEDLGELRQECGDPHHAVAVRRLRWPDVGGIGAAGHTHHRGVGLDCLHRRVRTREKLGVDAG